MDKDKLLDEYIDEKHGDWKAWMTDEQRKALSGTFEFAFYCMGKATEEFVSAVKAEFRWIFGGSK